MVWRIMPYAYTGVDGMAIEVVAAIMGYSFTSLLRVWKQHRNLHALFNVKYHPYPTPIPPTTRFT
jgi:hypothetical protein